MPHAQHPGVIFVNKLDREGRDPFEILDELEAELKISVRPLSWPINIGAKFKGVYNIYEHSLDLFTPNKQRVSERVEIDNINDPRIDEAVGQADATKLRDDLELIEGVYPNCRSMSIWPARSPRYSSAARSTPSASRNCSTVSSR